MVRIERARFCGHVDIEVSYKILQLEILNEALIFFTLLSIGIVLMKNTFDTLRVNHSKSRKT
jgi:hypothetical protein